MILKKLVISLIVAYQKLISPLSPRTCRFEPSCSEYAKQAILKYGLLIGFGKGLLRLSRCHPWNAGGFDPVK